MGGWRTTPIGLGPRSSTSTSVRGSVPGWDSSNGPTAGRATRSSAGVRGPLFRTGAFWTGERDTLSINAAWGINTNIGLSGTYDLNLIDLARYHWIVRPGSEFFIVYNELDDRPDRLAVRNRSLVVKLNYLFSL